MPYVSDGRGLHDQGNGTFKDDSGNVFNYVDGQYYMIYDQEAADAASAKGWEELQAQWEKEKEWAREANRNAGGLSFLNPLNLFKGIGSGGILRGMFSGLAGGIIKAWVIIFLVVMIYTLLIDPVVRAIGEGITTIGIFFRSVIRGIKAGIHFIWVRILWFLGSWILTFIDIARGVPGAGFFGNLIFRILTVAEICLIIAYLIFLIKKFKGYRRFPGMIRSDILEPAAMLLVFELVKWLLFPAVLGTGFFGMIYNVICLLAWVVIAELITIAVFRKKMGLW